ncbi:MAG: hypothetical protein LBR69_00355 [Endomicrobium sp.]|jgi:cell division transport system permease protein|nr:hypothetical protein [Endomicrobium sp.]
MDVNYINAFSKALKLAAIAVFCAFCVLLSNHYYSLQNKASEIFSGLDITVFLDKDYKDEAEIRRAAESSGLVSVEEFVSSQDAYLRVSEKYPFLKDVSVPQDKESFQAYLKVSPKNFPTPENLTLLKNGLLEIEGIDEAVMDSAAYGEYVKIKSDMGFYFKAFVIFAAVILVLFMVKSVLFVLENKSNAKKLAACFFIYLLAASAGFMILWSACVFIQYPLSVKEGAVFCIIPFSAVCGIIFKD